jgi:hypothetical protein
VSVFVWVGGVWGGGGIVRAHALVKHACQDRAPAALSHLCRACHVLLHLHCIRTAPKMYTKQYFLLCTADQNKVHVLPMQTCGWTDE